MDIDDVTIEKDELIVEISRLKATEMNFQLDNMD